MFQLTDKLMETQSFSRGRQPGYFFITKGAATAVTVRNVSQPFLTHIACYLASVRHYSATIQVVAISPVH